MADFDRILVNEIPRLRRLARALVTDPAAADDLVQDTVERALRRRWQWRGQAPLRFWLNRILVNRMRNDRRRRALETRASAAAADGAGGGASDQPATQLAHLRVAEIERALARLPAEQRDVLVLVVVEGLAYDEVAGVLGIPIGTVRSRLARARASLDNRAERPRESLRRVK